MNEGLIIVSNRLPVSVSKVDGKLRFSPSIGGLATGLASYAAMGSNKWIGWPGIASDDLTKSERRQIQQRLRKENCHPVFLSQKQLDGFYSGYSNRFIWPVLHDISVTREARKHEAPFWRAFQEVNQVYAEAVLSLSKPSDRIWVHDYLLMLVPKLLRAERPDDTIGFFLHTPFPEPAMLKELKHGRELMEGILSSSLIGFQIKRYTRNFMQCIEQLKLGEAGRNKVTLPDRAVRVTDFPIGIDYEKWRRALRSPKVQREIIRLRRKYLGKKIIVMVDRQDISKGLPKRVEAYHELLRRHPELHGKVQLVMIGAPTRTDVREYQLLKDQLDTMVAAVNAEFGTPKWLPIDYSYNALPFEDILALFQRADVGYIAPFRDGMNLLAKEYVASKQGMRSGVLILTTSAGAAQELTDAVMVDPLDVESHVKGLYAALTMSRHEARLRIKSMQRNLSSSTIHTWAQSFMGTLQRTTRLAKPAATQVLNAARQQDLLRAYTKAFRPLILLDYDGVLTGFYSRPEQAKPSKAVKDVLKQLASTPGADVVIVTGREPENIHDWLGGLGLHFAAEHGAFTRLRGDKSWRRTPTAARKDWQDVVQPILETYAELTPGAFVEQKNTALVWHYRDAKAYSANKNLVILRRLLKPLAASLGLKVHSGKKILEVKAADVNKGNIASSWLAKEPDFILALGDDYTDEDTFKALPAHAYTIKVGEGRTAAHYRLKSRSEVLPLLKKLANH